MTSPATWNAFSSWYTTPGVWQPWFISYRTVRRSREKWRRVLFEMFFYKIVNVFLCTFCVPTRGLTKNFSIKKLMKNHADRVIGYTWTRNGERSRRYTSRGKRGDRLPMSVGIFMINSPIPTILEYLDHLIPQDNESLYSLYVLWRYLFDLQEILKS